MKLWSVEKTFEQEPDTNSSEVCHTLTLATESGGLDGPDYIVLSTKRWALDPEELPKFFAEIQAFVGEYIKTENGE